MNIQQNFPGQSYSRPDEGTQPQLVVRKIAHQDVTPAFIHRWQDLVSRSCHHNAFLSPDFLLPAWKWLGCDQKSFLITVEEKLGGRLRALGCFEESPGNSSLPLPHLEAVKTNYSVRSGLLLDEEGGDQILQTLLSDIRNHSDWAGVVFPGLRLDSILAQRLQSAVKKCELSWHTEGVHESAAFFPPIASEDILKGNYGKSLRRKLRNLESAGPVRLRWIERPEELPAALEQFLFLEDAGWKGTEGTSMLADGGAATFLKEMASGFHQHGGLVITQLLAGEQVVASAINIRSGSTLFALKIGWDPQFAKAGPGTLHEHFLLPLVCQDFPDVTCVDGCSRPGSYLEDLWPHRVSIGDAIIPISRLGSLLTLGMNSARFLKKLLCNFAKSFQCEITGG